MFRGVLGRLVGVYGCCLDGHGAGKIKIMKLQLSDDLVGKCIKCPKMGYQVVVDDNIPVGAMCMSCFLNSVDIYEGKQKEFQELLEKGVDVSIANRIMIIRSEQEE